MRLGDERKAGGKTIKGYIRIIWFIKKERKYEVIKLNITGKKKAIGREIETPISTLRKGSSQEKRMGQNGEQVY